MVTVLVTQKVEFRGQLEAIENVEPTSGVEPLTY